LSEFKNQRKGSRNGYANAAAFGFRVVQAFRPAGIADPTSLRQGYAVRTTPE
jgi:hypothetical protein